MSLGTASLEVEYISSENQELSPLQQSVEERIAMIIEANLADSYNHDNDENDSSIYSNRRMFEMTEVTETHIGSSKDSLQTSNNLPKISPKNSPSINSPSNVSPKSTSKNSPKSAASKTSSRSNYDDDYIKYSDEELEQNLQLFITKKKVPSFLMRDQLVDYIKRKSLDALIDENYDEAAKIDKILIELQNAFKEIDEANSPDLESQKNKAQMIENRIASLKNQQNLTNQQWEKRINDFKEKEQEKIEILQQNHQKEREKFEEDCQSRYFLSKFSKPSTQLLQLRRVQKSYALAHDFEAAKSVKAQADLLQIEETKIAQRKAMNSVKVNYLQLVEKQQREIDCYVQNSERKLFELQQERERQQNVDSKVMNQLGKKLVETKTKKNSRIAASSLLSTPTKLPPLTANKRIAEYRRSPEKTQLELKLTDLSSIFAKAKHPK